jgi:hypothetical protein
VNAKVLPEFRLNSTGRMEKRIMNHSVLIACVVAASFFLIFFGGSVALSRERIK